MEIKNKLLKPVVLGLTYLVLATGCSSNQVSKQQNFDFRAYQMQEEIIRIRNERTRFYLQTSAGMKSGTVKTRKWKNGYVVIEGDCSPVKSRSYREALHQADTNGDGWVSLNEAKKYYRQTIEDRIR